MSGYELSDDRREQFWADGYLCLEGAMSERQLAATRADFEQWREMSSAHTEPYGETLDGRPRFDLEPGHSAKFPALRRWRHR